MPAFTPSEYEARLSDVQGRMADTGMDLLWVTDPANICWLSGYDGWSFYVHQGLLVCIDEPVPLWIGRQQDANGARATSWLPDAAIVGYPDDYVQSTVKHPMDFVADVVRGRGWQARALGVEKDAYYFTGACLEAIGRGLPDARLVDGTGLVNWARAVKSPAELDLMRQASRIVEAVVATAIERIEPGLRQCDLVAEIYRTAVSGMPDAGGDYPSIVPLLPSGQWTSAPHMTWSDAAFQAGEPTILELAGCRQRYHCPMCRTVYLGDPPQAMADAAAVIVEGLEAALAAARPGATCEEVEAAWRRTIAKAGIVKDSRIGYSTGLNYPPDWGEHTMSLRPGDRTVLQENMTLHCVPGIWQDGWGIEISECFRVGPGGGEPFCSVPRDLIVKR